MQNNETNKVFTPATEEELLNIEYDAMTFIADDRGRGEIQAKDAGIIREMPTLDEPTLIPIENNKNLNYDMNQENRQQ